MLSGTNHGHAHTQHQHHQSRLSEVRAQDKPHRPGLLGLIPQIDINIACGDGDARYLTKRIITQIMGGSCE